MGQTGGHASLPSTEARPTSYGQEIALKKIGIVVAGTATLLLTAAPFAFADSQGQTEQHNDQHCGDDSDEKSFQDFFLFSIAQDHENDSSCKQDEGSGKHHSMHGDKHQD